MTARALFLPTYRGDAVEVDHATPEEIMALVRDEGEGLPQDVVTCWNLIAVRYRSGRQTEVHALGWRVGEANTWITSPLQRLDEASNLIWTRSGKIYRLEEPDDRPMDPALRDHLAYALRMWGFTDV